jgi:hypothetical protein
MTLSLPPQPACPGVEKSHPAFFIMEPQCHSTGCHNPAYHPERKLVAVTEDEVRHRAKEQEEEWGHKPAAPQAFIPGF